MPDFMLKFSTDNKKQGQYVAQQVMGLPGVKTPFLVILEPNATPVDIAEQLVSLMSKVNIIVDLDDDPPDIEMMKALGVPDMKNYQHGWKDAIAKVRDVLDKDIGMIYGNQ